MTNLEKIKKMRVGQLADFIISLVEYHGCYGCRLNCHKKTCKQTWIEWLKSEAKKGEVND